MKKATENSSGPKSPYVKGRAREIVEALSEGFIAIDRDAKVSDCNRVLETILTRRRRDILGRNAWKLLGVGPANPFAFLAGRVSTARIPQEAEISYRHGEGEARLLLARIFPLGKGLGATIRDITDVRASELKLAESEAQHRELAEGTPAAAWLSQPQGGLEFINQAMADTLGRPREALLGEGWLAAIDPEDRPAMLALRSTAQSTHTPFRFEGRFRAADSNLKIIQLYGRPRFGLKGEFNGFAGMATDVTAARDAERRQAVLVDELNHRVKNTLATVQALIHQVLRDADAPKDLERRIMDRLLGLSAAHDVLTREHWAGASLIEIAQAATMPQAEEGRIRFTGPPARVTANTAIALSMALHELTTNALKHGALSNSQGHISLSWTVTDEFIDLYWQERGGPPVTPPTRSGFGTRLLGRRLTGDLGRPPELTFAAEGLECRISVAAQPDAQAAPPA